jgi:CelD/BcsL family acetyltransferase involved in cellulose biosynthesis
MDIASTSWTDGMARSATDDVKPLAITATTSVDEIRGLWDDLARRGVGSPFQSRPFVEAWFRHLGSAAGAEPLYVVGRAAGGEGFVLPLAVTRSGPARIARFPGGNHANYNLGLYDPAVWQRLRPEDVHAVYRAVADAGAGGDLIRLDCLPRRYGGRDNPFVDARAVPAEHNCYAADLTGGFDALLSRHRGSKKRGRMKARRKALAAVGGYAVAYAETEAQGREILEAFFVQKSHRFAEQGLPDVFACPKTRDFFRDVVSGMVGGQGVGLDLWSLTIDGEIRATNIGARIGGTHHAVMNSFAMDEYARHSTGDMALFHVIEDCCARGLERFDFGIGDMRYKRSWTDEEVELAQSLTPLTATGAAAVFLVRARRRLRDEIVRRPGVYRLVQRLRRVKSEVAEESGED